MPVGNLTESRRGHGGRRLKLVVPDGVELAEYAVPVREAANLTGVSFQAWHQMIERGFPCYLHEGRKYVLVDDMATAAPAKRQAAAEALPVERQASHEEKRDHRDLYGKPFCEGRRYERCWACRHAYGLPAPARGCTPERRAQLERARATKAAKAATAMVSA